MPNEPVTVAQLRCERRAGPHDYVLAELDGVLAGCGIVDRSSFGGRAFIAVRVLEQHRRRGVGTALLRELAGYARSLGLTGINAFVYADEPHSIAFAENLGLHDVDYQLEQVRTIGDEPAPVRPAGDRARSACRPPRGAPRRSLGRWRSRGTRTCRFPAA